jgi:hypothetical protein
MPLDPTAVDTPASAEGIAGLRSETLADPAFRAAYLSGGEKEKAALETITKLENGLPLAPGDLSKLPDRNRPPSESEIDAQRTAWGTNWETNLASAKSAAEALGFGPPQVDELQRVLGYASTLTLLHSVAGKGNARDTAAAAVKQLLANPTFVKAYRSGGGNSPQGRLLTSLQRITLNAR